MAVLLRLMRRCVRQIHDRTDFDGGGEGWVQETTSDRDGIVQIGSLDESVSAELLASFGEGPVGHRAPGSLKSQGGGSGCGEERRSGQKLTFFQQLLQVRPALRYHPTLAVL